MLEMKNAKSFFKVKTNQIAIRYLVEKLIHAQIVELSKRCAAFIWLDQTVIWIHVALFRRNDNKLTLQPLLNELMGMTGRAQNVGCSRNEVSNTAAFCLCYFECILSADSADFIEF
jgi:hypothetical protein